MLPWYQGRPSQSAVVDSPMQMGEEEQSEVSGLRAMAMKAIAQDLLAALETRDVQKTANVLECLACCIGDME